MRRILFASDDLRFLEETKRSLRLQLKIWEISFIQGAKNALAKLEHEKFDVLVSDLRMRGMHGGGFLRTVKEKYPEVIRILLCDYREFESALHSIPVSHQVLPMPCGAQLLQETIEHNCNLNDLLHSETLRAQVGSIDHLPSLPAAYSDLTAILENPSASLVDAAKVVERDIAMVAKILQVANSAYFGLARRVKDIRDAVNYLGTDVLKTMVLSVEVFRSFGKGPEISGFSLSELQSHAFETASAARVLINNHDLAGDAFMAGMLHDIGKLVMAKNFPDRMIQAIEVSAREGIPFVEAEKRLYGITHAEIGAYLLGLWGLPFPVVEAVAYHHEPAKVAQREFGILGAVYVANYLSDESSRGESSEGPQGLEGSRLDLSYLDALGVAAKLPEWRQIVGKKNDSPAVMTES